MIFDGIDQVEQGVVVVVLNTLLDLRLAGLRQLRQDVFLSGIPQVPRFGAVKILQILRLAVVTKLSRVVSVNTKYKTSCQFTLSFTSSGMEV